VYKACFCRVRVTIRHHQRHSLRPQCTKYLRFCLIIPVSSATAEWSFFALKRLKTFTRSTVTQTALLCYVHQDRTDKMDLNDLGQTFVSIRPNERRGRENQTIPELPDQGGGQRAHEARRAPSRGKKGPIGGEIGLKCRCKRRVTPERAR